MDIQRCEGLHFSHPTECTVNREKLTSHAEKLLVSKGVC